MSGAALMSGAAFTTAPLSFRRGFSRCANGHGGRHVHGRFPLGCCVLRAVCCMLRAASRPWLEQCPPLPCIALLPEPHRSDAGGCSPLHHPSALCHLPRHGHLLPRCERPALCGTVRVRLRGMIDAKALGQVAPGSKQNYVLFGAAAVCGNSQACG